MRELLVLWIQFLFPIIFVKNLWGTLASDQNSLMIQTVNTPFDISFLTKVVTRSLYDIHTMPLSLVDCPKWPRSNSLSHCDLSIRNLPIVTWIPPTKRFLDKNKAKVKPRQTKMENFMFDTKYIPLFLKRT